MGVKPMTTRNDLLHNVIEYLASESIEAYNEQELSDHIAYELDEAANIERYEGTGYFDKNRYSSMKWNTSLKA